MSYLRNNDILYDFQSGFRSDFSTDSALVYLTDKIRFNMDNGLMTSIVLMDLQKAFNTVNHEILLDKLQAIGFNAHCVNWFSTYLSNQCQFVSINGKHSNTLNMSCGVPQGSILGPLLFLIYVNDMSSISCDLYLYADDSALLTSGKDVCEIQKTLETNLSNASQWLIDNKLSLHLGKTESVIYGSKQKIGRTRDMDIKINDVVINAQKSVKYLGAHLDQSLSGTQMSNNVIKMVDQCFKFMYRKSDFLDYKERLMLCNAIIQPAFDYGSTYWYRALSKAIRSKLQICQNKMVRYILDLGNRTHIGFNELNKVKWLNVEKRVDFKTLCNMYKIYYNLAPQYLRQSGQINHCHNTRYSNMAFNIPNVKSNGKNTFKYSGIVL